MSYPLDLPASLPLLTLTHPNDSLWVIELHNGQDNRLIEDLITGGIMPALDAVEKAWRENWRKSQSEKKPELGKGAVIIVGRKDQDKFFSNGLDFASLVDGSTFFALTFNPLLIRLLTFPIPSIAAINGHCFAGGFMLALACDYRVMFNGTKRRAWLCMNEIHFGAAWPSSFTSILRAKFGDTRVQRKIALEGHKYVPKEALEDGVIDLVLEGENQTTSSLLEQATCLADSVGSQASAGVWGLIKSELYRDTIKQTKKYTIILTPKIEDDIAKARL